jgi:transcriptional regulator with XRE-family HTH domain
MDLDGYLDLARQRARIPSDRRLALAIGVSHTSMRQYRHGLATPSPERMLALAELAGVDPTRAIVDRMAWQADGPRSRAVVSALLSALPSPGSAGAHYNPGQQYCDTAAPCSIDYGKSGTVGIFGKTWRFLLDLFARPEQIAAHAVA